MEAHLRGKLDAGLKGLDTSVASAMTQSRVEVEKKMSGDVAALRSEVADAKAGSEAAADKLHAKVERVETATHAAWAARQAQVAAVSKDHADFEAHATTTLAHVKDSLSHTKVSAACVRACVRACCACGCPAHAHATSAAHHATCRTVACV
jgi:ATP/maltotriose-dependent transcriptional regulator MalT